jgi:hypothetical protein
MIGRLKAMASGRLGGDEGDARARRRLGLNPEALAKLRWTISDGGESKPVAPVAPVPAGRPRLRAVDPAAAAVS